VHCSWKTCNCCFWAAICRKIGPSGGGDFRTLEEAAQIAPASATLYLKAGIYNLSHPLQIDKPLSLIGEGMDKTKIVCEGEGYAVKFAGKGLFLAHDLTFQHQGLKWANVVEVLAGEVDVRRCRITGGVFDPQGRRGSAGLCLLGQVRGTVAECQVSDNGLHGIAVGNQAQPVLEGNTCAGNKYSGIAYFESAKGSARQNTCSGNQNNGISVCGEAQPALEANTCQENKQHGIFYFGSAKGTARQNTCASNEVQGICVGERAEPALEGNTCERNKYNGISYHKC
jgi:parallel beta-helix repeat protein